ncbi:hypothetical protein [Parendozoicomonas sp. Alg238-R29]|uniref:flagellar basal body rod protein FlgB n=1 Tax=Parendozoicomonas sp. Alg238-R29 TaxID=2993446 RepID=UPI00248F43FC|nr:hypothetical protein [Parendozoicomonas sp. Alg238-R29]
MAISFSDALGNHPELLNLQVDRVAVYGSNLVNSETPHYRASDFDIAFNNEVLAMNKTNARHLAPNLGAHGVVTERPQLQSLIQGNSVDVPLEQSTIARTLADYAVNTSFIRHQLMTLSSAITGR